MKDYYLIGIDPGFASLGYAVVRLASNEQKDEVECLGLISTEKSSKKRNIYVTEDNLRRLREIRSELVRLVDEFSTDRKKVVGICAEAMSFPRNASAAAKVAMAWGVIVSLDLPIFQTTPQEIKKVVSGTKSASKTEVEAGLKTLFKSRGSQDIELLVKDIAKSKREHLYDALAAVVSCGGAEAISFIRSSIHEGRK